MHRLRLRCPHCTSSLTSIADGFHCLSCDAGFSVESGVADLRSRADPSSEPVREQPPEAESFSALIRSHVDASHDRKEALYETSAWSRTAWKLLLRPSPDGMFLALGCGTGLVPESVAPLVGAVAAADFSMAPLRIAKRRFERSSAIDNVALFAIDHGRLPFADALFDGVVVGRHVNCRRPNDECPSAQADAGVVPFVELLRVLKPEGQLFWLADNRISYARWSSSKGILTSRRAATVTGAKAGLSYFGYGRLLRKLGCSHPRFFALLRTDDHASGIRPLSPIPSYWRPSLPRGWKKRIKLHKLTVDTYGILVDRGLGGVSFLSLVLDEARGELSSAGDSFTLLDFRVGRKDKVFLDVAVGETRSIVRVPLSAAAMESEERNARMLELLSERDDPILPRSVHRGLCQGVTYFIESVVPGSPLSRSVRVSGPDSMLDDVERLHRRLNPNTDESSRQPLSDQRFTLEISDHLEALERLTVDSDTRAWLRDYFYERLHGVALTFGWVHGDFSISNILVDNGRVSGLIDWEGGSEHGPIVLDSVNYVDSVERAITGDRVGVTIPRLASGRFSSPAVQQFLFRVYANTGIDAEHHEALVYLRWLRHMSYLSKFWLSYDSVAIDTFVTPVVNAILRR